MTTHELLENVFKYSIDGFADVNIALRGADRDQVVQISASNRATAEALVEVSRRLDELHDAPDPIKLYYQIIARSAKLAHGSGLGLARICAEGEMDLSYVIQGDRITIIAETPVETISQP
jgi:hypothetical protein